MDKLSKEEYFNLVKELVDEQYGTEEEVKETITNWNRSSYAKARIEKAKEEIKQSIEINMTDYKSEQILKEIFRSNSIKVSNFIIRINRIAQLAADPIPKWHIKIWEKRFRTPAGSPCNIDYPLNMQRDKRFENFKWKEQFMSNGGANSLTSDIIVDTIRWLQIINKLPAFL